MSNFNAAGGSQSNKFSLFIFSTKVYFTFIQSCLRVIRIAPPGLDYFNGNVILNAKRAISDLSKSTTWGHIEKQQNLQGGDLLRSVPSQKSVAKIKSF